ncbi:uncharacterized protein [Triticum aestivum]|uniref:uncharacterized protein n=1 Tax=Triticum aestivum TaxID=4565 RepID=UPI001D01956D|nr:uncharacterized protein LOC123040340 [Triticum aestivum]
MLEADEEACGGDVARASSKGSTRGREREDGRLQRQQIRAASLTSAILATGGPVQGGHSLGQEGRGQVPSLPAPMVATSGQADPDRRPPKHASLGQEGQGLAARSAPIRGVLSLGQEGLLGASLHSKRGDGPGQEDQGARLGAPAPLLHQGQEGHVRLHLGAPPYSQVMANAAASPECPIGQEGQGIHSKGAANAVFDAADTFNTHNQVLFEPGVLEALTGAVAARLASPATAMESGVFTFTAKKNPMQGNAKRKERKGKKKGGDEKAESARKEIIGKKRGDPFGVPPTGSDQKFSFEREMDSYERVLYGDMSVSSKRVCMGRVDTMRDGDGIVTHVAKET